MLIGKALLLKGLGGLTALGGAIGGGCYLYDHFSNQETKFDRGLIDYLEAGGKIQFSVKNGSDADISDSFPQFTTGTSTLTATIKVSVNTATSGTVGTLTDATTTPAPEKGQKSYLQKLNGDGTNDGTDWTWICEIKFTKKAEGATANELADKDKLVQSSTPKGFFDKLKEKDNSKELKIKFIKDCAAARGKDENRKINKLKTLTSASNSSSEIKTTKTFELIDNSETNNKKLIPEDQSDFNYWFGIK